MILDIFVVSKRISLVSCIFLNNHCKLLSENSKPGSLKTFPRDPTNSHAKEKGSFLVDQLQKILAREVDY